MLINVSDSNKMKRQHLLRKALFNTFFSSIIFDGFVMLILTSSRFFNFNFCYHLEYLNIYLLILTIIYTI